MAASYRSMSISSYMFTIFSKRTGLRLLHRQFYGHGLSHQSYNLCSRAANLGPPGLLSYPFLFPTLFGLPQLVVTLLTSTLYTSLELYHLVNNSSLLGNMTRFATQSKLTLAFPTLTQSTCSIFEDPSSSFVSNMFSTLSHSDHISCII
jgi:hypothetical protein